MEDVLPNARRTANPGHALTRKRADFALPPRNRHLSVKPEP